MERAKVDICDEGDFDPFLISAMARAAVSYLDDSDSNDFDSLLLQDGGFDELFSEHPGIVF